MIVHNNVFQSWDTFTPAKKSSDSCPVVVNASSAEAASEAGEALMSTSTTSIVYGRQFKAIQGMLDFDYVCRRSTPSVACIVDPFNSAPRQDFYWGSKQVFIPSVYDGNMLVVFEAHIGSGSVRSLSFIFYTVYKTLTEASGKHQIADVLVNFASLRSAYDVTVEAMDCPQIRTIAIIAEGIPENMTRDLIQRANKKGVTIIGERSLFFILNELWRNVV